MIKKIIYWLLCLEIYLRRTNIKPAPWREKIKRYLPSYQWREYILLLLLNKSGQAIYVNIFKCARSTLRGTLFGSEQIRKEFLDFVEKKEQETGGHWGEIYGYALNKERSMHFYTGVRAIKFTKNQFLLCGRDDEGFKETPITLNEINNKLVFTFVRNPFSRFVSFFQDKYKMQPTGRRTYNAYLDTWLENWLFEIKNFETLAKRISILPNCYNLDSHALPQHLFFEEVGQYGIEVNFIGRFENLSEDFQRIQKPFGLIDLEHRNPSSKEKTDWRNYYSPKTAKLIYKRYRKDFEQFGYEDEYPKLLEYIKTKR